MRSNGELEIRCGKLLNGIFINCAIPGLDNVVVSIGWVVGHGILITLAHFGLNDIVGKSISNTLFDKLLDELKLMVLNILLEFGVNGEDGDEINAWFKLGGNGGLEAKLVEITGRLLGLDMFDYYKIFDWVKLNLLFLKITWRLLLVGDEKEIEFAGLGILIIDIEDILFVLLFRFISIIKIYN